MQEAYPDMTEEEIARDTDKEGGTGKYRMLFNVATGVAIGAVIGYAVHVTSPKTSENISSVVSKALGLEVKDNLSHADFSAGLSGITTLAAIGGLGGIVGAVENAWNPPDQQR